MLLLLLLAAPSVALPTDKQQGQQGRQGQQDQKGQQGQQGRSLKPHGEHVPYRPSNPFSFVGPSHIATPFNIAKLPPMWTASELTSHFQRAQIKGDESCTVPPAMPIKQNFDETTQRLMGRLEKGEPFAYIRWGDGEWLAVLGHPIINADGVPLGEKCLGEGLKAVLNEHEANPNENLVQVAGTEFLCKEQYGDIHSGVNGFFTANKFEKLSFSDGFSLPLGAPDNTGGVMHKSRAWPVVIVGPKFLSELHCMLNHTAHVDVPPKGRMHCDDVEGIVQKMAAISAQHSGNVVFYIAAGPFAKMIVYKGFRSLPKDTFIDIGSALDAYAGVASRDYNNDLKKWCQEAKSWMSLTACSQHCNGVGNGECQKCGPDATGAYQYWR